MYFIYTMLLAMAWGWYRSRSLQPLRTFTVDMTMKGMAPLVLMLLTHWTATLSYGTIPVGVSNSLHVASIAFTLLFIWMNRSLFKGTGLLMIGTGMNLVVIATNGGRMPVSTEYMEWYGGAGKIQKLTDGQVPFYTAMTQETWFPYFADLIPMFNPTLSPALLSMGDVFMCIGVFLAVNGIFRTKK